MTNLKSIVIIPARLASSRLPGKILADIDGHPMLWHVYQRCLQATKPAEIHIATDSEEIASAARSWGAKVWMTSPDCASGTERIASVIDRLDADFIVNVQGDQPLLEPSIIDRTIETFENTNPLPDIVTPACDLSEKGIFDPNVVKMVKNHAGYAMYFSRSPIPYVRDEDEEKWFQSTKFWGHVGIYGYKRQVLEDYPLLPASALESAEKLEQLRFLEAGKTIMTFVTDHHGISVDAQWQLDFVRELVAQQ